MMLCVILERTGNSVRGWAYVYLWASERPVVNGLAQVDKSPSIDFLAGWLATHFALIVALISTYR